VPTLKSSIRSSASSGAKPLPLLLEVISLSTMSTALGSVGGVPPPPPPVRTSAGVLVPSVEAPGEPTLPPTLVQLPSASPAAEMVHPAVSAFAPTCAASTQADLPLADWKPAAYETESTSVPLPSYTWIEFGPPLSVWVFPLLSTFTDSTRPHSVRSSVSERSVTITDSPGATVPSADSDSPVAAVATELS